MSRLLSRPIPLSDGTLLRTLEQARALTEGNRRRAFVRAAKLIDDAEASGSADDIERVTGQIEMVLFGEAKLDLRR